MNAWSRGSLLLMGLALLAPRLADAQEAAEVTCKDGTKSHGGKGACSGHGGVDKSASKSAAEPAEKSATSSKSKSTSASATSAAAPATAEAAEVICKDGTTSHAGKGACSGHGGVDKSASKSKSTGGAATTATEAASSESASKSRSTSASASSAAAPAAAAAEVVCKDGTTSHGGKGACSGHGGVDKSASASKSGATSPSASASAATGGSAAPTATAPPEPAPTHAAAPAPAPTATAPATKTPAAAGEKGPPTAKCKDGSLSYAQHHTGACSNHGGVAEWLDGTQK